MASHIAEQRNSSAAAGLGLMRVELALMHLLFPVLADKEIEIVDIITEGRCSNRALVLLSGIGLPDRSERTRWVDPLFSVKTDVQNGVEVRSYSIDWRPGDFLPKGFYADHLKKLSAEVEAIS